MRKFISLTLIMAFVIQLFSVQLIQAAGVTYTVTSKVQWDGIRIVSEDMAAVMKNVQKKTNDGTETAALWGFINTSGKVIVEPKYDSVGDFHEGYAWCYSFDKDNVVVIDKTGKVVLDGKKLLKSRRAQLGWSTDSAYYPYIGATNCSQGIIGFVNVDSCYIDYYDLKGKFIAGSTGGTGMYGRHFTEDVACVEVDAEEKKVGFINKSGKLTTVSDKKITAIYPFNQGLAPIAIIDESSPGNEEEISYLYGIIDKTGKYIVKPQLEDLNVRDMDYSNTLFNDDLAVVRKGGKWGAIDKSGKVVVKFSYYDMNSFKNGFSIFQVKEGGKFGVVDKKGKVVVSPIYDKINDYNADGIASFMKGDKWGYIDTKGKVIIEPKYDDYSSFRNGIALVKQGSNYFWIDSKGKKLDSFTPDIDSFYGIYDSGYIIIIKDNKYGLVKIK